MAAQRESSKAPPTALEAGIFAELGAVSKEPATTACALAKFESGVDGSAFYVAAASSTSAAAPAPWAGLITPRGVAQSHSEFRLMAQVMGARF